MHVLRPDTKFLYFDEVHKDRKGGLWYTARKLMQENPNMSKEVFLRRIHDIFDESMNILPKHI